MKGFVGPPRCFGGRKFAPDRLAQRRSGLWNRPPPEWSWVLTPLRPNWGRRSNHGRRSIPRFRSIFCGSFRGQTSFAAPADSSGKYVGPRNGKERRGARGGGRLKKGRWRRRRCIFARLRSVSRHFAKTFSGCIVFWTKLVCVAPPRNQGGICRRDKSSVATSGCTWFLTRRPRSG